MNWDRVRTMYDHFEEVTPALQLGKLVEEVGEAWEAYLGLMGANPRKGVYGTRSDVAGELMDVIITAAIAMLCFTDDPEQAEETAWRRVMANYNVEEDT